MEVAAHWIGKGYPVRTVCQICGIARSSYYYHKKHPQRSPSVGPGRPIPGYSLDRNGRKVPDTQIKQYLLRLLRGPNASFGYRKLTILLRRTYHLILNKKKVYRLCKELQILSPQREIQHPVPRKIVKNRVVSGPNQLWQMDLKYGYVAGKQRHFYVASIIDVFDRRIVAHHRGKACKAADVEKTVQKAVLQREVDVKSLVIRTDNGPQFTSKAFYAYCGRLGLEHERIPNKTPNSNAYIESFHSILERECFQRHCFASEEQAFAEVDRFLRYYNNRRIHGSLQDWPPKVYLDLVKAGVIQPEKITV